MADYIQTFRKQVDRASIEIDGHMWFVRYNITVPVVKTVLPGGDWFDDYEIDIIEEEIEIDDMMLYDPEDPNGHVRVLAMGGIFCDTIDPRPLIRDMLRNDDKLFGWLDEQAINITP